ncbi:hypothetical protein ACC870_37115, partial [Rhizobium ruizarguesonis]
SDLGITPQTVQVTVKNGQVTLDGNVESELQPKAVSTLVESLGVGAYRDRLQIARLTGTEVC